MTVVFRTFLDAKFLLDSRSLNPDLLTNLQRALAAKPNLRCLDFGAGTGAMAKRLTELNPCASLDITGIDIDADLLNVAADDSAQRLRELGFETTTAGREILARRGARTVRMRFDCAAALDWKPGRGGADFDLITAHAFMDIVPLQPLVEKSLTLLAPAGIFYTTLNYDGETALVPVAPDETFERKILEQYDRSMEDRRIDGMPTGGARSGRRLAGALLQAGFELLGFGSSDWNITPVNGAYRDQDAFCLKALLAMIHDEASRSGAFDPVTLEAWYSDRCRAVDAGIQGIIVHQMDILARKRPQGKTE